jgi:uncharacterized membrane protein YjgN (DUF898 family)
VRFTGDWREFLPIAFTNLLLTIVTLGIYRFWAKARERRYLWSRTLFIEDNLEWTGTGKEMFIGFLLVILIFLPVALLAQFAVEALLLRGETAGAALLGVTFYAALFYLIGVAKFRALRYRLSRTYWRGIRGGSEDRGWRFGVNFVWKTVVGIFLLGFLVPWAMTSLWNDRWNRMSFGQHEFDARADTDGLFGRWLFVYLVPVVGGVVGMTAAAGLAGTAPGTQPSSATLLAFALVPLVIYVGFLLASLSYYAAFYRQVASATRIAGLEFAFTARTKDWLKLILGNIGLVIVTLGFGLIFLGYRNWSFVVRHSEAYGLVDLDELHQSTTRAPGEAEGLADAFDIGAI